MTHFLERTALVLLVGTALTAGATTAYAQVPAPADAPFTTAPAETRAPALIPQVRRSAVVAPPASAAREITDTEAAPTIAFTAPAVDAAARSKARATKKPVETEETEDGSYKVRRGDTLAVVATKVGSDIQTLARLNGLKTPYRLTAGETLKVPGPAKSGGAKSSARKTARATPETYTVQSGDTLFSIARKFDTTVEALKSANGMGRSSSLARGRKLKLSGGADEIVADEPEAAAPRSSSRRPSVTPVVEELRSSAGGSATGRVVNIDVPGKAYRVRKGDTLERVARKLAGDMDDLARINHLKRPYRLRPGQTIRAVGTTAKAYQVGRGDTLAGVAERFGVTVDKLRSANGLKRGASLAPGRKLRLPAGYRDRGPSAAREPEYETTQPVRTPPPERAEPPRTNPREPEYLPDRRPPGLPSPSEALPPGPQPYTPSGRPQSRIYTPPPSGPVAGAPTTSVQVSDAQIMQMGRGLFAWPARGDVLSGFGSKGTGQRNDGLNIRANAGDPVRAAAAGDVVYAGDQVPGFGNLVLIKHADGWVTAYGHMSKVEVRMQQKVSQGQEIGEAGSTGGVSEPQVHFEVRYAPTPQERARPVDPALVLPK